MADSPEEALEKLNTEAQYIEIENILNTEQISEEEIFYVFEGHKSNSTEWYVAYVKKHHSGSWFVAESYSIGLPNKESSVNYSAGKLFRASIHGNGESTEEGGIAVPIPNSEYFVRIELTD